MSSQNHQWLAEAALVTMLSAGALIPGVANAQQGRPATGGDSVVQNIPLDQLPIDQRLQRDPQADPNLPGMSYPANNLSIRLRWNFFHGDMGSPALMIVDPSNNPKIHGGDYLGWNEEGSLINADNGKIYVWNYKQNTIKEHYKSFADIPTSVLASLKNSESKQEFLASRGVTPATKPEQPSEPQVAKNDARNDQGVLADAARAIGQSGAGVPTRRGTGAADPYSAKVSSMRNGILTVAATDGTNKTFKVERPPTPQSSGAAATNSSGDITGTWVSFDDNKLVVILGDQKSVTVSDLEPRLKAVFEMQKKMFGAQKQ